MEGNPEVAQSCKDLLHGREMGRQMGNGRATQELYVGGVNKAEHGGTANIYGAVAVIGMRLQCKTGAL